MDEIAVVDRVMDVLYHTDEYLVLGNDGGQIEFIVLRQPAQLPEYAKTIFLNSRNIQGFVFNPHIAAEIPPPEFEGVIGMEFAWKVGGASFKMKAGFNKVQKQWVKFGSVWAVPDFVCKEVKGEDVLGTPH